MDKLLTTCGFCGCGCGMYVEPRNGRAAGVCASENHPVSKGRLCIKGWYGTSAVSSADRLQYPLIRRDGRLTEASWEEALSFTASEIKRIISETGPGSIGIIGSGKLTNEEAYALVKFSRSAIRTPNIDSSARFYSASAITGLAATLGATVCRANLDTVAAARSMLIVGANVTEQLPQVGARIREAAAAGCRIIAADPRVSRLAPFTTMFLHPAPGTDLIWLRFLIKTLIEQDLCPAEARERSDFAALKESLAGVGPDRAREAGLEPSEVVEAARMLADNPPLVVMFGLGAMQQPGATEIVKALADIAILLGGSILPLRVQNNAEGAAEMGLLCEYLPGYAAISDTEARKRWEGIWNCELPPVPGMSAVDMVRACQSGEIRGLFIFGENAVLSAPNTSESRSALEHASFLAVSDLYLTDTAAMADVVFPACSFLEKDGSFTNIERRVQRIRKIIQPLGSSKTDLEIISALSSAFDKDISTDPEQVLAEISTHVPDYGGISYRLLDREWGYQLPPGKPSSRLAPVQMVETERDQEYPLRLITSRAIYPQQTGTMCRRFPILSREYPEARVELNEADAGALGLRPGRSIRISSRSGSIIRSLALSDSIPAGCVHLPYFPGGDSPNVLTSYDCDEASGVPLYKACAVKIEAVE